LEVFLVEKLDFSWDEVHEIAEQLEHIKSEKLINKLDDFWKPYRRPSGIQFRMPRTSFENRKAIAFGTC
jgi:Mn-dependent DtxR family transcriptional regulator